MRMQLKVLVNCIDATDGKIYEVDRQGNWTDDTKQPRWWSRLNPSYTFTTVVLAQPVQGVNKESTPVVDTDHIRGKHIGNSDYSTHKIQPWDIWLEYNLNPWDADMVKRLLRTKEDAGMTPKEQRIMDYQKIIHNCQERIRQLET